MKILGKYRIITICIIGFSIMVKVQPLVALSVVMAVSMGDIAS